MTNCQSCGMPMNAPADFGGGKTDNPDCKWCTDPMGNLLPKEVVRQNMIELYTKTMGKTPEEAMVEVDKIMSTMPAWKIQASPVAPVVPVASEPIAPIMPEPVAETPVIETVAPVAPIISEPLVSEPVVSPVQTPAPDKPQ